MADNAIEQLKAALAGGGGAGSGSAYLQSQQEPDVWLGSTYKPTTRSGGNKPLPGGGRLPTKQNVENATTLPLSAAQQYPYTLDPAELQKLAEKAWYLGYDEVATPADINGFISLWQKAVTEAAKWQANGKRVTPMQVLELGATGNTKNITQRTQQGGVRTQKSRSINLTDPVSAKALVRQAIQTAYGRDATDAEVQTLVSSLLSAEKANPQVTAQSATFDATGQQVGDTTTTTSGGLNPADFLQSQVQDTPEAKQFQAASTYFPALMQLMGSSYGL